MDNNYTNDPSWDSLFDMAEDYGNLAEMENSGNEVFNAYDSNPQNLRNMNFQTPEEALKVLFGYDAFRTGQKDIIENILSGRDVLAVMPTGAGKSICYQIPAMILPGVTLVISPLISLMQDQVSALREIGVSCAFINSSLSGSAYFNTIQRAEYGEYKIIYVAPERLLTEEFLQLAKSLSISMVTVDEAHCISQWGQDFRPSYVKIAEFIEALPNRPIVSAFTATATRVVRDDICSSLKLQDPFHLVTGFDRENLFFQIERPDSKDQFILNYIRKNPNDSGIIYCATRKNVEALYETLNRQGIPAAKYHGGMGAEERKKMQEDFVYDYTKIVVATNAFGMGIDKSNVRFVIHYNMPSSMENYYQEAGRAGRDGLDAKCILLFSTQDIAIQHFLLERKDRSHLEPEDISVVQAQDERRLQQMEKYCYTTECLRNYILKYFGEEPKGPCENCGNCLHEFETIDMTEEAKKIINCVYELRGRFGRTVVLDTVAGANTAKLREINAVSLKSYGVLASSNKKLLRRLMEQMVLEGYLVIGDYQVVKLGDIQPLRDPDTKIFVKITDDDKVKEKPKKTKTSKSAAAGPDSLTPEGVQLFEQLRQLRLTIAREEHMPPYIIFADKTLVDMAYKSPKTKEEMLMVSGVGENKFGKYGERFLEVIRESAE